MLKRAPQSLFVQTALLKTCSIEPRDLLSESESTGVKVWWIRLHVGLHAVLSTSSHPLSAALTVHSLVNPAPDPDTRLLHPGP